MKCEKCNSKNVRRSSWKRNEHDKSHVVYAPYRCRDCEHRFFRVSRTFKGMMLSVIGALAFLSFIISMYFVTVSPNIEAEVAPGESFDPGRRQALERAKKGNAEDQFALGLMAIQGDGRAQNFSEAIKWFQAAAKQGHTGAELNMGLLYKNGRGVLQDYSQAAQWFQKAAVKGHTEAEYQLATLYKVGQGVKHDMKQAYAWYNLSAASGYEPAIVARENIATFMSVAEVAEAQALSRSLIDPKAATTHP